ncbi:6-carboxytetrahydropterin synthase [Bacillus massiliglaciei]|uniref:6-carboxytetrahydropterin synthase n=1 Tax=Bacillus massiliglaciei TaxID=1816693 RepID=UPI000A501AAA|nr:6-carboxytetrahydropterin synthase [Bacillus massiliglaciei]
MHYLSRREEFSAAHFYHVPEWSEEKNESAFGKCHRQNGHGHDYQLEVMVRGNFNRKTGIVVNTTDIKHIVNTFIAKELDGKFLNKELPFFKRNLPTTENLVNYIWNALHDKFEGCELYRLRLNENHYLSAERKLNGMTYLTRKYHFCAAHRLHSIHLSDEENKRIFGKCNNPHGHGHNYYVDVQVHGEPHHQTGMIIDLAQLDEIVEKVILDKFDHKHLNLDTEEFAELNPTSEAVAMVIYELLAPHIPQLYKIGLWETEKNYFEYFGEREK